MTMTTSRLFIDRQQQREEVCKILDALGHAPASYMGVEFYGIAGSGKARLLDMAKDECRARQLAFAIVDLSLTGKFDADSSETDILMRLCDTLDSAQVPTGSAREIVSHMILESAAESMNESNGATNRARAPRSAQLTEFRRRLVDALEGKPLVLFLKNTQYCPDEVFDWLGEELVGPFAASGAQGFALFISGRGPRVRESRWSKTIRNVIKSFRLDPFDLSNTQAHIEQLPPKGAYASATKAIYGLSNGHPYSTETLVSYLDSIGVQANIVETRRLELARCLYDQVIKSYILQATELWMLPLLETASIPRRFDAGFLAALGPKYRSELTPNHEIAWYIFRIEDLRRRPWNLISVGDTIPAYKLDPTFRRLLHTALASLTPDETAEMHAQAHALYADMLKPATTKDVVSFAPVLHEMLYHKAAMAGIMGKSALPPTQAELESWLTENLGADMEANLLQAESLKALLRDDVELRELLEEQGIQRLIQTIEQGLARKRQAGARAETAYRRVYLSVEREEMEYRAYLMQDDQIIIPGERIANPRKYSEARWRANKKEIGLSAFNGFLPSNVQEHLRARQDLALQINSNTTDVLWELFYDEQEFWCLAHPMARKPMMGRRGREHPANQGPLRALVIGDPLDDLPEAAAEARAVSELLQAHDAEAQIETLVGSAQASAEEFVVRITNYKYDLIHYAGHGQFNPTPSNKSALVFKDGPVFCGELERNLGSAAFIFLSACEGAAGATQTVTVGHHGEFMEGLAVSAALGGAIGCLGALWKVEDDLTKEFALKFYQELLSGKPIGEAVRDARLYIRERAPYSDIWASWVLYGDPMKTLPRIGNAASH